VRISGYGPNGPISGGSQDYIFPDTEDRDDWLTEMPPVATQIGGASGTFDYYDDEVYPIAAKTVTKRYRITGTYTFCQTHWRAALRQMLSNSGNWNNMRLWGTPRGTTVESNLLWSYAKLIRARAVEIAGEGQLAWPAELIFYLPEGIWYQRLLNSTNITANGTYTLYNLGDIASPVKFTLTPVSSAVTKVVINIGSILSLTWDDSGGSGVLPGNSLVIDCEQYSVLNNGVDAYDKLSLSSGQVVWFALLPVFPGGDNQVTVTVTQSGGTFTLNAQWKTPFMGA
jgi:hypothetical protein